MNGRVLGRLSVFVVTAHAGAYIAGWALGTCIATVSKLVQRHHPPQKETHPCA